MKISKNFQFLAYLIIMLILLSIIPEVSFAAKDSSGHGKSNQDKYMRGDARNSSNNETDDTGDAGDSEADKERRQNNSSVKDRNRTLEHKQEKKQLREELQVNKQEYNEAKGDFLKIRNLVRAGKLDPNSEEALNATKLYLNSSVNYMALTVVAALATFVVHFVENKCPGFGTCFCCAFQDLLDKNIRISVLSWASYNTYNFHYIYAS